MTIDSSFTQHNVVELLRTSDQTGTPLPRKLHLQPDNLQPSKQENTQVKARTKFEYVNYFVSHFSGGVLLFSTALSPF